MRLNPKLRYLCRNPKINGGTNYPPFIYLFKDGLYYKFDNKYEPKRPFGNLIEGGIAANKLWPGIHFPGATSYQNDKLIIIYPKKWSRWRPNQPNQPNQTNSPDESNKPNQPKQPNQLNDPNEENEPNSPNEPNKQNKQNKANQPNKRNKPNEPNDPNEPNAPNAPNEPNQKPNIADTEDEEPTQTTLTTVRMEEEAEEAELSPNLATKSPKDLPDSGDDEDSGDATNKNNNEVEANDVSDEPILDEEPEIRDEADKRYGDAGALIPIEGGIKGGNKPIVRKYAKVFDDILCYLIIDNSTAVWDGKCKPVVDDPNNFPQNIIAFIRPKNKLNYFINKRGEYCVREDKDLKTVLQLNNERNI